MNVSVEDPRTQHSLSAISLIALPLLAEATTWQNGLIDTDYSPVDIGLLTYSINDLVRLQNIHAIIDESIIVLTLFWIAVRLGHWQSGTALP